MNTLRIYKAPSGQWAGKVLDKDGDELGRVGGCASPDDVEEAALDNGLTFDEVSHDNMGDIKSMMALCKTKGWDDAVRLLDQSEVMGTPWGNACTMQVLDYMTGEWLQCTPGGKAIYSIGHWYKLIRSELAWDGPVRLAVASE